MDEKNKQPEGQSKQSDRLHNRKFLAFYIVALFCVVLVLIILSYLSQVHSKDQLSQLNQQLGEQTTVAQGAQELSRLAAEFPRQCRPIGGIRETVDALHREGIRCLLVTSGPVQSAQAFALHWGLDAWDGSHYGVTDGIFDGALPGHIGDRGKIQCVERYCSQVGASLAEVTAVGDGGTDIPLFGRCGCSIALNYGPEAEGKATHYLRTDDLSHILPLVP